MTKLEEIMEKIMNSELVFRAGGGFLAGAVGFGAGLISIYNLGYDLVEPYLKESIEKASLAEQFDGALVLGLCGGLVMGTALSIGYGIECLAKKREIKKMKEWAEKNPEAMKYYS